MPSHAGEDRRAGRALPALARAKEQGGGVGNRHQAAVGHLENADLVRGAKAVLDRAEDAELMAAFALEIQHRVDHVLEHAGARDGAVLGDMADEQEGGAAALGGPDQFLGGRAHLADRAGGGV